MTTYFDKIIYLYPNIQGVMFWHSQYDGTPWDDPYDGVVWENTQIEKPTKETLDALNDEVVATELNARKVAKRIDNLVSTYQNNLAVKVTYSAAKEANPDLTFRDFVISLDNEPID